MAAPQMKIGGIIKPTANTRDFWIWALRNVPAVAEVVKSGACYDSIFKAVKENAAAVKVVAADPNTPPVVTWVIESWLKAE